MSLICPKKGGVCISTETKRMNCAAPDPERWIITNSSLFPFPLMQPFGVAKNVHIIGLNIVNSEVIYYTSSFLQGKMFLATLIDRLQPILFSIIFSCSLHFYTLYNIRRHGDMLFMKSSHPVEMSSVDDSSLSPPPATPSRSQTGSSPTPVSVVEDSVDVFLEKQDGRIYREKDDQLWEQTCSNVQLLVCFFLHCTFFQWQMSTWSDGQMFSLRPARGTMPWRFWVIIS